MGNIKRTIKKRGRPFANKDLTVVLKSAAKIFSQKGFDGAQIKEIGELAEFTTSLIHYHFHSKEDLWKQTVKMLGDELLSVLKEIESDFTDLEGVALMKAYNRHFIYFSAKHPEFFKIAFHEIGNESHRATWLLEEILMPIHEQFSGHVTSIKNVNYNLFPNISAAHFHSLILGAANMFFALSFQYKHQFGVDSFDKDEIDKYVDFVNDTVFARFDL